LDGECKREEGYFIFNLLVSIMSANRIASDSVMMEEFHRIRWALSKFSISVHFDNNLPSILKRLLVSRSNAKGTSSFSMKSKCCERVMTESVSSIDGKILESAAVGTPLTVTTISENLDEPGADPDAVRSTHGGPTRYASHRGSEV
jgi:hypothetical protein